MGHESTRVERADPPTRVKRMCTQPVLFGNLLHLDELNRWSESSGRPLVDRVTVQKVDPDGSNRKPCSSRPEGVTLQTAAAAAPFGIVVVSDLSIQVRFLPSPSSSSSSSRIACGDRRCFTVQSRCEEIFPARGVFTSAANQLSTVSTHPNRAAARGARGGGGWGAISK